MITVTIMKIQKWTLVVIFRNMDGNIPAGNFLCGNFPGENSPERVWLGKIFWDGIFLVGVFLIRKKIYVKNLQMFMHWHWSSPEKCLFSKPKAVVFSPPPVIIFFHGVEIFPHPLVQLLGHVSALIEYIEM